MKKIINLYNHNRLFYSLSFLIPALMMAIVLWSKGIYWGSSTTILASDGFHQYVIFANQLRNILHGSDSIFYTFTSGLGLNFYALISYYLGSFLSPFYGFFTLSTMPDAVYLFTLVKFGLIGLSMGFTLRHRFKNLSIWLILSLSTSYALMGFAVSQLEINTWLDVFILVPVILLGLHLLLEKQMFLLYYVSLTLLFIQNYYFGFMTAIFLTFYFLAQLTRLSSWKSAGVAFIHFSVLSLLSGLTSSIMLIPTYFDLSTHGEEFSKVSTLFTEKSWALDIFAKNLVGAYDTTKFGALPMIYVGLFPLLMALLFFFVKGIKWSTKLAYFLLIAIFIASFYLNPLDLLWQGMHAPNMFLHRYAWLFSTLIIMMAAEALSLFKNISSLHLGIAFGLLASGFVVTLVYHDYYTFVKSVNFLLTFTFLITYAVILASRQYQQLSRRLFLGVILLFSLFEIGINSYFYVTALGDEWVFPTRDGYQENLQAIDKLVSGTKEAESYFYRTERLLPQTGNDSMKYNYNGISQFSSIRNTQSSSVLDRLGFQSFGTNLNLRYQNNTIIADSLFAIKYNISQAPINKYGFHLAEEVGSQKLYKNNQAASLAIMTEGRYHDLPFTVNTLDNQTRLLNALSGSQEQYFTRLHYDLDNSASSSSPNRLSTVQNDGENASSFSFSLMAPAHKQVYVSLPSIVTSHSDTSNLTITINGQQTTYTTDNAYSFFDLGYYDENTPLSVTVSFPESDQVSFDRPVIYALDTVSYQKAMTHINQRKVDVSTYKNTVTAKFKSKKSGSLFFTLPYDKGWKATLNGKAVPIRRAQKGFMAVDIPKGQGQVQLIFKPHGFTQSVWLSLFGILLFVSYHYLYNHCWKVKHDEK